MVWISRTYDEIQDLWLLGNHSQNYTHLCNKLCVLNPVLSMQENEKRDRGTHFTELILDQLSNSKSGSTHLGVITNRGSVRDFTQPTSPLRNTGEPALALNSHHPSIKASVCTCACI